MRPTLSKAVNNGLPPVLETVKAIQREIRNCMFLALCDPIGIAIEQANKDYGKEFDYYYSRLHDQLTDKTREILDAQIFTLAFNLN